jgi:GH3 auxin-responsive promoter
MLATLGFRAAHAVRLAAALPAYRAFRRALADPAAAQATRLRAILARAADSAYGRRHGFARLRSPADYQAALPVVGYEDLRPAIEAVAAGRPGVLTGEPVRMLETTGGSTGPAKLVPYTSGLLGEFQAAIGPWLTDLAVHRPALRRGGAYWSVSPCARPPHATAGGIPVGFADDTEYFGRLDRRVLRHLLLTPPELARVPDLTACRYVTLRFLLETPHLAFVSVWSPSFLTLLLAALDEWAEPLLDDLAYGTLTPPVALPAPLQTALAARLAPRPARARRLRATLARDGRLGPRVAWPDLALVSCWTGAAAARFVPALQARLPGVEIQGKGLLATEGVVSVPLLGHPGAALAVTAHFYEFVPAEAPGDRPRLAHELDDGASYTVLLTTGGGLYRYALGDVVRVVGRVARTPLVEFTGRAGGVSDLCGEKLAEGHVARVVEEAAARLAVDAGFLMLAPEWAEPPYYALFVDTAGGSPERADRLARAVEEGLAANPGYAYGRALGQLGPVRAVRMAGGSAAAAYADRCAALGQRAGAVKPTYLHATAGWRAFFAARLA